MARMPNVPNLLHHPCLLRCLTCLGLYTSAVRKEEEKKHSNLELQSQDKQAWKFTNYSYISTPMQSYGLRNHRQLRF